MSQSLHNAEQIFAYIKSEVKRTFNIDLTRRDFLKLVSGGMLGAVAAGFKAGTSKAQDLLNTDAASVTAITMPNGVAAGDITQSSAVLWTRSTAFGTVTFSLLDADGTEIISQTTDVTNPMQPVKVTFDALDANTPYQYQVTDAAENTLIGQFKTFAEDGTSGLRFGVSGDWRGELRPYPAIANAPSRDLDFFVELGDTIYADHPSIDFPAAQARSLEDFRIKHNEVYSTRFGINNWAALRASTAIFTTIDDHEVTDDFAGGANPENTRIFNDEADVMFVNQTATYRNGLQVFSEYNPTQNEVYQDTGDVRFDGRPKLYRYRRVGQDAAFFILDARSFRDPAINSVESFFSSDEINRWNQEAWQADRTMLGRPQVDDLKRDLQDAQSRGIIWKFIMMPEPVQQMGWFAGEDRWEGYAPERTDVLRFIEEQGITNVVFISADIHTTLINDLTYQTESGGDLITTGMWEISTGSVAYYPPTGQAAIELVNDLNILLPFESERYTDGDLSARDNVLESVFDRFILATQRLNRLGLESSSIDYDLITGGWAFGHSFGWTEFDIDAISHALTVTTYGIESYSADDMSSNPDRYLNQDPQILGQMVVRPIV